MLEVIHGNRPKDLVGALDVLGKALSTKPLSEIDGIFYYGYPLIKTPDGNRTVHALLVSEKYGVVAFDVLSGATAHTGQEISQRQDMNSL